jgi:hypothetical protein
MQKYPAHGSRVCASQHLQTFGSLLALTLGFERIGGTLFGSAKRLDSGLVGCGWFDDFSDSHQVFSITR